MQQTAESWPQIPGFFVGRWTAACPPPHLLCQMRQVPQWQSLYIYSTASSQQSNK